jgi:two-component system chemotaxis sensor kinase CheA
MSGVLHATAIQARADADADRREVGSTMRQSYLVFRAGSFGRLAVPLSLVARLEEFPLSRVEQAAGRLVVQYRGQLLPLVPLASVLEQRPFESSTLEDPVQVVVFSDRDRVLGLLVDQVVDILDDTIEVRQGAARLGIAGSAVIGKKVTDFVDLAGVFSAVGEDWFAAGRQDTERVATVMVADASAFSRALVKNSLELMGHRVVEAASAPEALGRLEKEKVDVLIADVDLPSDDGGDLVTRLRRHPALAGLRTLGLTTKRPNESNGDHGGGYDEYLLRYDREEMLRAVMRATNGDAEAALEPELMAGRS